MSLAVKGLNRDGSQYQLGLSLYFRFVCHPICSSSALTHESFDLVKFIQKSGSSLGLVLDKRYHSSTHLLDMRLTEVNRQVSEDDDWQIPAPVHTLRGSISIK